LAIANPATPSSSKAGVNSVLPWYKKLNKALNESAQRQKAISGSFSSQINEDLRLYSLI
jgi:hypothetical protein